jgi:hypothetical protein
MAKIAESCLGNILGRRCTRQHYRAEARTTQEQSVKAGCCYSSMKSAI